LREINEIATIINEGVSRSRQIEAVETRLKALAKTLSDVDKQRVLATNKSAEVDKMHEVFEAERQHNDALREQRERTQTAVTELLRACANKVEMFESKMARERRRIEELDTKRRQVRSV
jgi:chromosome segregation ATPase